MDVVCPMNGGAPSSKVITAQCAPKPWRYPNSASYARVACAILGTYVPEHELRNKHALLGDNPLRRATGGTRLLHVLRQCTPANLASLDVAMADAEIAVHDLLPRVYAKKTELWRLAVLVVDRLEATVPGVRENLLAGTRVSFTPDEYADCEERLQTVLVEAWPAVEIKHHKPGKQLDSFLKGVLDICAEHTKRTPPRRVYLTPPPLQAIAALRACARPGSLVRCALPRVSSSTGSSAKPLFERAHADDALAM